MAKISSRMRDLLIWVLPLESLQHSGAYLHNRL